MFMHDLCLLLLFVELFHTRILTSVVYWRATVVAIWHHGRSPEPFCSSRRRVRWQISALRSGFVVFWSLSSQLDIYIFRPLTLMENRRNPTSGNPYFTASRGEVGERRRGLEIKHTKERSRGHGGRFEGGSSSSGKDKIDALGRLLTRILRHMASELKLDMRSDGYVRVQDLLKLNLKTFANIPLRSHDTADVREAVRRDNKQRFSLLEENGELLIRANQGHTIEAVETESLLKLILSPEEIPVCVHGTYRRNLESVLEQGLKRMKRLHVHFSCGLPTDGEVISGMRHDINMLIFLDVRKAMEEGMKLYISDNRVILTEGFGGVVPMKYFLKIESWPKREPIRF